MAVESLATGCSPTWPVSHEPPATKQRQFLPSKQWNHSHFTYMLPADVAAFSRALRENLPFSRFGPPPGRAHPMPPHAIWFDEWPTRPGYVIGYLSDRPWDITLAKHGRSHWNFLNPPPVAVFFRLGKPPGAAFSLSDDPDTDGWLSLRNSGLSLHYYERDELVKACLAGVYAALRKVAANDLWLHDWPVWNPIAHWKHAFLGHHAREWVTTGPNRIVTNLDYLPNPRGYGTVLGVKGSPPPEDRPDADTPAFKWGHLKMPERRG